MESEAHPSTQGSRTSRPGAMESSLRRRAPGVVLALGARGLTVAAGLAGVMLGDASGPYAILGRNVNGADGHVDAYLACALGPGRRFRSNAELEEALAAEVQGGGAAFATQLVSRCNGELAELSRTLGALIPPEDLAAATEALVASARALHAAARDYAEALGAEPEASPSPRALSRAWYEYRHALAGLNDSLRDRLSPDTPHAAPRSGLE